MRVGTMPQMSTWWYFFTREVLVWYYKSINRPLCAILLHDRNFMHHTVKVLFIHPNFPGQYRGIAPALQAKGHEVSAMSLIHEPTVAGIPNTTYQVEKLNVQGNLHRWVGGVNEAVMRGEAVAKVLQAWAKQGHTPDVVIGHSGWGEMLFVKDILPHAKVISFCEYFYKQLGADVAFDPEFTDPDAPLQAANSHVRNMHATMSLLNSDVGVAPTEWQASLFPKALRERMTVIHEGIDTSALKPSSDVWVKLGRHDAPFRRGDEIMTFVNRNLEPMRGYHQFMRALPAIQKARPNARIVIVGGDGVSYGPKPVGMSYKERYLNEVRGQLDMNRIHFVSRIPYPTLIKLLQVSAAHIYLTYPFVLSWSMLEAMSLGALVIGSKTPPVEEVITHGHNGLLTDFFSPSELANTVIDVLKNPSAYAPLREHARQTVIDKYDFETVSLPAYEALLTS